MAELKLKQQQLNDNIARATQDRDAEGQTALANNEDLTNAVLELQNTPYNVVAQAHGPVDSVIPTYRDRVANYEALVDVIKSKTFLNQIQNLVGKGAGSLSDAEGAKLEGSLRSLSLKQTPEQMFKGLAEMLPLLSKANSILKTRYAKTSAQGGAGSPTSGGKLVFVRDANGKIVQQPASTK